MDLAAPDDFIPALPDWRERSVFIARHGTVEFFHYDFYAQALAKVARDRSLLGLTGTREIGAARWVRISELARIIGSIHLQQPDYTLFLLPSCATNGVHL